MVEISQHHACINRFVRAEAAKPPDPLAWGRGGFWLKNTNLLRESMAAKRKKPGIGMRAINILAINIGLPSGSSIREVVDAYVSRLNHQSVPNNNHDGRKFLLWIIDSNIDVPGVKKLEKKSRLETFGSTKKASFKAFNNGCLDLDFVKSERFLSSYEWRELRMKVFIKYGRKCSCCGATPANGAVMQVDHIKPRKKHPELALDISNLQVLCGACNHGKGNWDETDWRNI